MKFVAYYRVSRKEQGISGLGLSAQRTAVEKYVQSQNGVILDEFTEIETGTNKKERIEIHKAIQMAKKEGAILCISKIDRLARNLEFVTSLMNSGVEFIATDMPTANHFTIHIFSALAEQESKLISTRTKLALAELKKTRTLGTPANLTPEASNKAIEQNKSNARNNINNKQATAILIAQRQLNKTYDQIAEYLNQLGYTTRTGKQYRGCTLYVLHKRYLADLEAESLEMVA
jgi:DNA invertase Pin-like site-specific DNA recombinase